MLYFNTYVDIKEKEEPIKYIAMQKETQSTGGVQKIWTVKYGKNEIHTLDSWI